MGGVGSTASKLVTNKVDELTECTAESLHKIEQLVNDCDKATSESLDKLGKLVTDCDIDVLHLGGTVDTLENISNVAINSMSILYGCQLALNGFEAGCAFYSSWQIGYIAKDIRTQTKIMNDADAPISFLRNLSGKLTRYNARNEQVVIFACLQDSSVADQVCCLIKQNLTGFEAISHHLTSETGLVNVYGPQRTEEMIKNALKTREKLKNSSESLNISTAFVFFFFGYDTEFKTCGELNFPAALGNIVLLGDYHNNQPCVSISTVSTNIYFDHEQPRGVKIDGLLLPTFKIITESHSCQYTITDHKNKPYDLRDQPVSAIELRNTILSKTFLYSTIKFTYKSLHKVFCCGRLKYCGVSGLVSLGFHIYSDVKDYRDGRKTLVSRVSRYLSMALTTVGCVYYLPYISKNVGIASLYGVGLAVLPEIGYYAPDFMNVLLTNN